PGPTRIVLLADLAGLAGLAAHALAQVAHALALVGLRRADPANPRSDLANQLLVDPLDTDPGRGLEHKSDPLRRVDPHRVGEAERQHEGLALKLRAVPHAVDLQVLAVPLGDAVHHICHQRPRQSVQRAELALVRRPAHQQRPVLALEAHGGVNPLFQLPLRPLDAHYPRIDLDFDARRDRDGEIAYP